MNERYADDLITLLDKNELPKQKSSFLKKASEILSPKNLDFVLKSRQNQ